MNTEWLKARPVMSSFAMAMIVLFAVLAVLLAIDDRTIQGEPLWLKPLKFSVSISVYVLTMIWFAKDLPRSTILTFLLFAICGAMFVEQAAITLQAARETTSHYNTRSAFDGSIYAAMGMGVIVNTLACCGFLLFHLWKVRAQGSVYVWGVRAGLVVFILGSLEGYIMIAQGAHTVGAPDGGPGIPVLRWSTEHGDLRIAHFLGIHALQFLPLVGWWADRKTHLPARRWAILGAFSIVYVLVTVASVGAALSHS